MKKKINNERLTISRAPIVESRNEVKCIINRLIDKINSLIFIFIFWALKCVTLTIAT